ncbi:hypothetical protein FJV41_03090 [Myxococcus llanfairpwllgwyngyllgogerychwyrndrobwllllantysiliogogogochensis]|uniref:PLAT domain-containing protein n=1 Tax=Myxococcus llanfairpwllgwyngyllgogerychwyrndrobwllllantysiliogogogochensis TaxID=2590453 RepID=A0A540X802_9BACT|nr:hypothetical protein [Myxococcus llanfairpwllgwyngyllgogerychwyrndrobwllllantysiliogogogochensis]TQF17441.1 hypothetical protein FJV41_03090 [Myxococcus llanfairpwllgwyngyllgogerychwyrndrobwllllantysiliogogogochensis]
MTAALFPTAMTPRFGSSLMAMLAAAVLFLLPGMAHADDGLRSVTRLRITVATGGDDLRNASHAVAAIKYVGLSGNQLTASINLNNGARWPDWTSHSVTMVTPTGMLLANLVEFSIQFTSGQPDIFATGDNWNMNAITVTAVLDDGTEAVIIQQADNYLHRFWSDHDTRWATAL